MASNRHKYLRPMTQSAFMTSPHAPEILKCLRAHEGKEPLSKIHERLLKIDSNLPSYSVFVKFYGQLNKRRTERAHLILADLETVISEEEQTGGEELFKKLANLVYSKAGKLGNMALDAEMKEAVQYLESGKPMPVDMRKRLMEYMFKSSDMFSKIQGVDINRKRLKVDDRQVSILENLLNAAMYGKLQKADIVDGEIVEDEQPQEEEKVSLIEQENASS